MNKLRFQGNATIKSGIWYTLCNFISSGIGFITTPVFSRLLTTVEYGEFANMQTWMMILLYISSLNLEATLLRASYEKKQDIDGYVLSMIALSGLSTLILGGLLLMGQEYWCYIMGITPQYLLCIFAYLLCQPSITLFKTQKQVQFQYKSASTSMMIVSIGGSVLSVLFMLNWTDKLMGRVIGYLLPICVVSVFLWVYYIYRGKHIRIAYWKYAIPISLPYIPHLLSLCLLNNMDKVMIRQMCGAEEVGVYSIACTCSIVLTILVGSVNATFAPWLANKLNNKEYDYIYKISFPYVLLFAMLVIGGIFLAPEILYVLGGSEYMVAIYAIPPLMVSCLVQLAYCMYVNVEQYQKKTKPMAIASLIAALTNFVLNYVFVDLFGYVAAGYTTLASYLVLLVIHMLCVWKMGYAHVFNNMRVLKVIFITIIIAIMQNALLKMSVIRYVLFAIYLIVLGNVLLKFWRKIKGK